MNLKIGAGVAFAMEIFMCPKKSYFSFFKYLKKTRGKKLLNWLQINCRVVLTTEKDI